MSDTENTTPSILSMDDESFSALDPSEYFASVEAGENNNDEVDGAASTPVDTDGDDQGSDAPATEGQEASNDDADNSDADSNADTEGDTNTPDAADSSVNYEDAYKRILSPFKANGKDIQVDSIDDALSLMQMGANYHKKMSDLKPKLKVMKLLERNNLMDENQLNLLLDIHNKKPGAIAQLIKDSGIDPMSLDVNTDTTYTPESHTVSDTEMSLDEVLESVQSSATGGKTLQVIANEWDTKSQTHIANNPQYINDINRHMANGIFDKVTAIVERERSLGKLVGVSSFDAYNQVGEYLARTGQLVDKSQSDKTVDVVPPTQVKDPIKEADRLARKKAAKVSKSSPKPVVKPQTNYLAMSDEEFLKLGNAPYRAV
jgi:hypothetical protein